MRNELGNVLQMTASRSEQAQWTALMQYNELGQEIERILPGDVISKWQYDITGRPTHHRVSSQSRDTRRRAYNWDINHQLRSMVNELTGVKVTYGYDEFSNLVWANQDSRQFDFLYRSVDDVGNLYETKDKKDRVYGAGSRLLETKDAKFSYDEEGNLVEKVEKNGDTWKYEYCGNGMMAKVIRPDNTEVTFKYDSLGRRIEKRSEDKATHFVWDGNTILHEYSTQNAADTLDNLKSSQTDTAIADNLVTWVFNEGFVPSAKITSEGHYSIISDYLGTPVEAYDEKGNRVWTAELDVYGRVKEVTGEKDFIPFRYQGQYEDVEIGLYYNRFRYYDPEQGNYTQIDPIGLAGGNPTLYGYVSDTNAINDPFGLKPKPKFNFAELSGNKPLSLDPNEIHFMQSNIKNSTGAFTVLENAESLKNGSLKVSDLPTVNVWKDTDGKI
ncbi:MULTISPECIES: RHS repeat domain-containing protein [Lysinibacillus]|uniref:RHS repeat domain-containing protein n=1 Tax=Lysinibacillus TaxID=400634 RepID=UPI0012FA79E4|nr:MULTISPECIES: RHS repeat-associated core domain-containing protein [Lysinibacillus]